MYVFTMVHMTFIFKATKEVYFFLAVMVENIFLFAEKHIQIILLKLLHDPTARQGQVVCGWVRVKFALSGQC